MEGHNGLTNQEVAERIAAGQVNEISDTSNKTVKSIIVSNTFTFFNFINIVLLILVLTVHSYKNTLFIFIIIVNTLIGIFQELKAKHTLDKLKILTVSHVEAVRNGKTDKIPVNEIVKDDLIILRNGYQIPADGVIEDGEIEVNESLLTGESDAILKKSGDNVLSGSFVTAGRAYCRVQKVGKDCYMEQLAQEAKKFKVYKTELQNNINRILKFISIVIIPIGILLFCKQYYISKTSYEAAALDTVAAVLGMIPEGLVLLTSIALALGAVRLAARNTLVRDLYCIETLARVDTLCLDKTGTITEGTLSVKGSEKAAEGFDIDEITARLTSVLNDNNETLNALKRHYKPEKPANASLVIPFSSDRKFSGAVFEGEGTYLIGAYQFIFKEQDQAVLEKINKKAEDGLRVLTVAYSRKEFSDYNVDDSFQIIGYVYMTDVIRKNAEEILEYFRHQGVELKVISGDDPVTVAAIAKRAGLKTADSYIDASTLKDDEALEAAVMKYSVFGRVTPKQKQQMVAVLKKNDRTVAMTGDGVNDVLALKDADVSIAMASGSEAAKNTANIVLMDSDFASMPHIVNEGRRVINNIKAAASMFLIKTGFSILTAVLTIIMGQSYPFQPIQLSVINGCAVGAPTFLLQLEPSFQKVDKHFFRQVLRMSLPASVTITIMIFIINNFVGHLKCSNAMLSTVCVLATGWIYLLTLRKVYSPMTTYRKFIIYLMQTAYLVCMMVGQHIMDLVGLNFNAVIITLAAINFSPMTIELFTTAYDRFFYWHDHKNDVKPPKPIKIKKSRFI